MCSSQDLLRSLRDGASSIYTGNKLVPYAQCSVNHLDVHPKIKGQELPVRWTFV